MEAMEKIMAELNHRSSASGLPIPDDAAELIQGIVTTRGGRLRVLRRLRKGTPDRATYLHRMYCWHRGDTGGSLWGPMMAQWIVRDAGERDRLDNLAMLMLGGSAAAERWRAAIHGR